MLADNQGLQLVVLFVPGADDVPAQAVIYGEARSKSPGILREERDISISRVEPALVSLYVGAGYANQIIGEVRTRLRAVELEATVKRSIRNFVYLVKVGLTAKLQSVSADDL